MFSFPPMPFKFGPFSCFSRCTKTTVIIKDDIFELYPEYKDSYFNPSNKLIIFIL